MAVFISKSLSHYALYDRIRAFYLFAELLAAPESSFIFFTNTNDI